MSAPPSSSGDIMVRHCIVTPDIIGPINNGGIGTHCYWFARLLRANGRDVTILFTGPMVNANAAYWRGFYDKLGIRFVWLQGNVQRNYAVRTLPLQQRSYDVYRFLEKTPFDVVHFQDWQGNGLQTLQARRTLGKFLDTCITVTLHSNTRWIAEGGLHWYRRPIEDAMTNWAEAFVTQYADMIFSPSRYMLSWARENGWDIGERGRVIPVCAETLNRPADAIEPAAGVLAFFGRLESRKGLDVFLKALALLPSVELSKIKKIYFVGSVGKVGMLPANQVIADAVARLMLNFEILDQLDSPGALQFLSSKKPTVFIPSIADNYPLSVIEAASLGLPVYASRVGGIPEILGDHHLFDPTPASLAEKIMAAIHREPLPTDLLYDAMAVKECWMSAMTECEEKSDKTESVISTAVELPLLSICVPYYNYPDYLPKLIESLNASTYRNFEVVVVDDGSTSQHARDVFDDLRSRQHAINVRFARQRNSGVGATRNAAAAMAEGEYLVFMDSDNLAKPEMLTTFAEAMQRSSSDILTCYFDAFEQHKQPVDERDIHHVYAPAGPALEVGWSENVFGDANFCIKKTTFNALGGFGLERQSSWEDWEFLVRAKLLGFSIEVIPKSLFWYRYTDEGFSRNTSLYLNQRRLLSAFRASEPEALMSVMEIMYQVASGKEYQSFKTPAGKIAGDIADRIYVRLGSPSGRFAQALEKIFKRLTN